MSWKKYAGAASGAVLGGILGNVPGAVYGAEIGYKLGEGPEKSYPSPAKTPRKPMKIQAPKGVYKKTKEKKQALKAAKKKWKEKKTVEAVKKVVTAINQKRTARREIPKKVIIGNSTGSYGGQFNKPTYVNYKKEKATVRAEGYMLSAETWGNVSDPHCIYINHGTYDSGSIARVIGGALLRKLFRKAGIEIGSHREELALFGFGNSDGFKIEYTIKAPLDGTYAVDSLVTVDNESFEVVLTRLMAGPFIHIENFIRNSNVNLPHSLCLYSSDRNGVATNWRLLAQMNLRNTKVEVTTTSVLTLQNRTAGEKANEGDLSLDRVDNQPLQGKIYEFKHADPRLRHQTVGGSGLSQPAEERLCRAAINGLDLIRSGQIEVAGSGIDYQEPPPAKVFSNCNGVANVRLEPGSMKKTTLNHQYKGYLPTLMNNLKCNTFAGLYNQGVPGKCQLIAVEEVLRTASTNPIFINYERAIYVGAYCYEKKRKAVWSSVLFQTNANNNP